jgi:hypothetical protein
MKKTMRSEPFNTGDRYKTDEYGATETSEPIDKFTNRSKMRNAGIKDHLMEAFKIPKATVPNAHHVWHHSGMVNPSGHALNQPGEFGRTAPMGAHRGVYGYGSNVHSAIPGNAVGSPPNRRGDNAVGHPPNRMGQNAVGHPPNRAGQNAVGNPPHRYGGNALASDFRPRFGKPHGNRT